MKSLLLSLMLSASTKDIPVYVLDKCIQQELDACPDKLCEMSYSSNLPIVEQAYDNLKECVYKEIKNGTSKRD